MWNFILFFYFMLLKNRIFSSLSQELWSISFTSKWGWVDFYRSINKISKNVILKFKKNLKKKLVNFQIYLNIPLFSNENSHQSPFRIQIIIRILKELLKIAFHYCYQFHSWHYWCNSFWEIRGSFLVSTKKRRLSSI